MTREECVKEIESGVVPLECLSNSTPTLESIESIFVILSALAVMVTAYFFWEQLRQVKNQIISAKSNVLDQISGSEKNARLVATLNLLTQVQTNPQWKENRAKFIEIRDGKEIRKLAGEDSDEAICVRQQLNQYELVALGISMEILDYEMYKRWFKTTVIRDWSECYPFIEDERKESQSYWVELESLVQKFKSE